MTNRSSESPASFFQDDMRFNKVHEVVKISREKIRVEGPAAFADQSCTGIPRFASSAAWR